MPKNLAHEDNQNPDACRWTRTGTMNKTVDIDWVSSLPSRSTGNGWWNPQSTCFLSQHRWHWICFLSSTRSTMVSTIHATASRDRNDFTAYNWNGPHYGYKLLMPAVVGLKTLNASWKKINYSIGKHVQYGRKQIFNRNISSDVCYNQFLSMNTIISISWLSGMDFHCGMYLRDWFSYPLLIIFKGQSMSSNWIPDNVDDTWRFLHNKNRWITNIHGLQWLRRYFEPLTQRKCEWT